MTPEWFTAIVALIVAIGGWIVTVIVIFVGAIVTYSTQKKLENFKGEIQQIVAEHDTRFSYLHERRGKVIDNVYKSVYRIEQELLQTQRIGYNETTELAEEAKTLGQEIDRFRNYYGENRFCLDEELCGMIDGFISRSRNAYEHVKVALLNQPALARGDPGALNQLQTYWANDAEVISQSVVPIRGNIEKQVRQILGIE